MGIGLQWLISKNAKEMYKIRSLVVPKGHMAVYVGELERKRYVIPISYLNHPSFRDLLRRAEEEFGFSNPMGGLTIPCSDHAFLELTSTLRLSS